MDKRSMAVSTVFKMLIMLAFLAVLIFIYFGHTGFFQKIYGVTDRLGLTKFGKAMQDVEQNITEARKTLTPEQEKEEEQIRSAMDALIASLDACVKGTNCVCPVNFPAIPQGYSVRFSNVPENNVHVNVFRFKQRGWYRTNYDENFQGQIGVDFVYGTNYRIKGTQMCLVIDLEENWDMGFSDDVDDIQVRKPVANMLQLYWNEGAYWATESVSPGIIYNSERDYNIYGNGGYTLNAIYKTSSVEPGRLCFFAERFTDTDTDLVDNIVCGKSQEERDD